MTNLEKYQQIFCELFDVDVNKLINLKYQDVNLWDSVGHMTLIASLEETFGIMIDTDDIIDFSSFEKGIEILNKYNVSM